MNEERQTEILVRVLEERLANQTKDLNKTLDRMEAEAAKAHGDLNIKVDGIKADLTTALNQLEILNDWRKGHNEHHGINDIEIGKRLKVIEDDRAAKIIANAAVDSYKAKWSWVSGIAKDGAKVVAMTLISGILLGLGIFMRPLIQLLKALVA